MIRISHLFKSHYIKRMSKKYQILLNKLNNILVDYIYLKKVKNHFIMMSIKEKIVVSKRKFLLIYIFINYLIVNEIKLNKNGN